MVLMVGAIQVLLPDLDHKGILALGTLSGAVVYIGILSRQLSTTDVDLLHGALPRRLRESRVGRGLHAWLVRAFTARSIAAVSGETRAST